MIAEKGSLIVNFLESDFEFTEPKTKVLSIMKKIIKRDLNCPRIQKDMSFTSKSSIIFSAFWVTSIANVRVFCTC